MMIQVSDESLLALAPKDPETRKMITSLSAVDLCARMKKGDLTVTEVTATFCLEARTVNQDLNCVTEEVFEEAIAEAKRKDSARGRGVLENRRLVRSTSGGRVSSPDITPEMPIEDQALYGVCT